MLRVVSNAAAFLKRMDGARKNQVPFAVAVALTRTARDMKGATENRIARTFDRPAPFTRRAVFVQGANKRTLRAVVGIKRIQAQYLGLQERGGIRTPRRRALLMPVRARLNRYGNLGRSQVAKLLSNPAVFSGKVRGVGGIWQRMPDGGLRLLIAYEARAQYRPRFGFARGAATVARQRFPVQFRRALAEFNQ